MDLQRSPPLVIFLADLVPRTFFPIHCPKANLVFLSYFVSRQEILKVPSRVGRLQIFVEAATAGRMRETDAFRSVEHQDEDMIAKQAVIKRLLEPQRRQVFVKRISEARPEFQLQMIVPMANSAFIIVALAAKLLPKAAVAEIHAFVLRRVDVIGPKQA